MQRDSSSDSASDSDEIFEFFSTDHLATLQVELRIKNSTTRMDFKNTPPSRITEITEHGMVLEVPKRSCASQHNLVVEAVAHVPKRESIRLSVTARVENLESTDDACDRITLSFIQVQEEEWNAFRAVFSSRQDEINRFLAAARGY